MCCSVFIYIELRVCVWRQGLLWNTLAGDQWLGLRLGPHADFPEGRRQSADGLIQWAIDRPLDWLIVWLIRLLLVPSAVGSRQRLEPRCELKRGLECVCVCVGFFFFFLVNKLWWTGKILMALALSPRGSVLMRYSGAHAGRRKQHLRCISMCTLASRSQSTYSAKKKNIKMHLSWVMNTDLVSTAERRDILTFWCSCENCIVFI